MYQKTKLPAVGTKIRKEYFDKWNSILKMRLLHLGIQLEIVKL